MLVEFSKYQGTGNDFVLLNNLDGRYNTLSINQIRFICDRRFGVGADGLIRINPKEGYDFEMDYFNADGSKSFCGNGARCAVAFAESLGIHVEDTLFLAIDGAHKATKSDDVISLEMNHVNYIEKHGADLVINTGSPHYIHFENQESRKDILEFGRDIRYSAPFAVEGINVNLVSSKTNNLIKVQTYERGVENETYSCGTGVTACAIATAYTFDLAGFQMFDVEVKGGKLKVQFNRLGEESFEQIWLSGPAVHVFNGEINA